MIKEALFEGQGHLKNSGVPNPVLDAQVLLSHLLGVRREQLYMDMAKPLTPEDLCLYKRLINLRSKRIPVAYIIGKKEFYGEDFRVSPGVLVPRPETELVVDKALEILEGSVNPKVADLCCGSGVIGISIALNHPTAQIFASDISQEAGRVTLKNAQALGVDKRLTFRDGDLWEPLVKENLTSLDLIVSNPPYIPSMEISALAPELLHEPKLALDGGVDGLELYKPIVEGAIDHLRPGGHIILEIGHDQAHQISSLLEKAGFCRVLVTQDLAGFDRVISATSLA